MGRSIPRTGQVPDAIDRLGKRLAFISRRRIQMKNSGCGGIVVYGLALRNRRSRLRNRILFLLALGGLIASASAQSSFSRYNFTAGGGLGIGRADVASYVGNSYFGVAGGGINFSRLFGVDAEYMYYNLGFRPGVELSQALSNQSGNMQSISLDGIVTVPRHFGKLGAYGIFGIGFYRRSVSVPVYCKWNVLSARVEMVGPDLG
jgi:hypothetical protein